MRHKYAGFVLCLTAGMALTAPLVFAGKPSKTSQATQADQGQSLYEQLGGEAAIDAAVDLFYDKVLADPRVNGFFKGVDMDRQRRMQKAFLTFAFGGPNFYQGRDLGAVHAHLVARGLNDSHFDVIVELLGTTLKELGVKDELIQHAAKVANSVRGDILGKTKPAAPSQSLYEQLGGEPAINAAVELFYDKVLADPRVNGFFKGVDMNRQRRMQKAFLTFAFGGPNVYQGRDLGAVHAHLVARGLNDSHFDVIVELLGTTLKELGVKDELIQHAAKVANSVRGDILGKTPDAKPNQDAKPDQNTSAQVPSTYIYTPQPQGKVDTHANEVDPELANIWSQPYERYDHNYLKKRYKFYPSNIAFEDNGVPFVAPSVFTCAGCHPQQYEDWQGSMHAQSFRDPIYLGELNLAVKAVGKGITKQCEGCHTAAAVVSGQVPEEFDFKKLNALTMAGVSCDVCHSIKRHTHWETPSHEPENGSYVLSPGRKDEKTGQGIRTKYGPFPNFPGCGGGFHECVESPLHLRAELCGGCHQVFHYAEHFPIEHTYNEWKKSIYAVKGIQCQDCHMVDIETYKRSADTFKKPKRTEYRHYFNGANFTMYFLEELRAKKMGDEKLAANAKNKYEMAVARLQAAAEIDVTPIYDGKGDLSKIKVRVHNKRCGHALPTSLTNIRQMWLEAVAKDDEGKELLRSGFIKPDGSLSDNTYMFNSDGMGHDMSLKNDPWEIVSFSRHDIIPPKGYKDVYYSTLSDHKKHDISLHLKLRFRVADQKIAHKLLTNLPKGFDLNEIYGLTEVPTLPVVDMIDKTVTFSTKGEPSKELVQERGDNTTQPLPPLYEKLGGEVGVNAVVGGFYKRVLADNRINGFFKGIEMERQEVMMKNFLTVAFGGPRPYTGRDLRAAHAHLVKNMGLNDSHFDAVLEHMAAALRDAGVENNLIDQVMAVANSVRSEVLNK